MTDATVAEFHPLSAEVQADPYPHYARLRRRAPVLRVRDLDLWIVSRYDDVRRVMHDDVMFSSQAMAAAVTRPVEYGADVIGDDPFEAVSIIGTDGERHSRLRHIVNRGFTPRRIAELEPEVRRIARSFVDELVASGGGDLQARFAIPFPTVVVAELLGVDPDRRVDFRRWSEHMILGVFEQPDDDQRQAIAQSMAEMGEWLDTVLLQRKSRAGDDFISVLLRAELDGGALGHQELQTFVFTLLVAGSITTAYLIGNATLALFDNPSTLTEVRHDRARIPALIEETLRYDAPTQMMFRTATDDTRIAGVTVPGGATVGAVLGSANRDEHVFDEPDRFDLHRASSDHLAFGHGVHYCLGAALARLEARVGFEELLARARLLEPAGDVERVRSLVFRGPTRLPVHVGT